MEWRTQVYLAVGFAVLITAATIAAAVFSRGDVGADTFTATEVPALTSADWTRGSEIATVTLTEYGDFECPACAQYEPIIARLVEEYGDRMRFGFRQFPLYPIHRHAEAAARAAEAAGLQDKYWEMHGVLYAKQAMWSAAKDTNESRELFKNYAREIGVDPLRFAVDLDSRVVTDKIESDVATGRAADVDHTPTFFLNGKQIPNPQNYEQFKSILDVALATTTNAQ